MREVVGLGRWWHDDGTTWNKNPAKYGPRTKIRCDAGDGVRGYMQEGL